MQTFPFSRLMVGCTVNHIIPKSQIENIPYDRRKHAFEYGPLYLDHALQFQELGANQIGVGQGQNLFELPLQDLFRETLRDRPLLGRWISTDYQLCDCSIGVQVVLPVTFGSLFGL